MGGRRGREHSRKESGSRGREGSQTLARDIRVKPFFKCSFLGCTHGISEALGSSRDPHRAAVQTQVLGLLLEALRPSGGLVFGVHHRSLTLSEVHTGAMRGWAGRAQGRGGSEKPEEGGPWGWTRCGFLGSLGPRQGTVLWPRGHCLGRRWPLSPSGMRGAQEARSAESGSLSPAVTPAKEEAAGSRGTRVGRTQGPHWPRQRAAPRAPAGHAIQAQAGAWRRGGQGVTDAAGLACACPPVPSALDADPPC